MKIFTETDRLIFREMVIEDAPDLFEMDSDALVHRYLGNQPVQTLAESKKMIEHILAQYKNNGVGRWAVVLKENKECIGWAGLKYVNEMTINGKINFYDIGYRFKRKHWGKGYGYEAAKASLDYGFDILGLKKISAFVEPENIASRKILTKIGLQYVESFDFEGEPHDWLEINYKL